MTPTLKTILEAQLGQLVLHCAILGDQLERLTTENKRLQLALIDAQKRPEHEEMMTHGE